MMEALRTSEASVSFYQVQGAISQKAVVVMKEIFVRRFVLRVFICTFKCISVVAFTMRHLKFRRLCLGCFRGHLKVKTRVSQRFPGLGLHLALRIGFRVARLQMKTLLKLRNIQ